MSLSFRFPTRDGIQVRGPLAPAWVSNNGEIKYGLPQPGESCVYYGTNQECESLAISLLQGAFDAGWTLASQGFRLPKNQEDTEFSNAEYSEYLEGFTHYSRYKMGEFCTPQCL